MFKIKQIHNNLNLKISQFHFKKSIFILYFKMRSNLYEKHQSFKNVIYTFISITTKLPLCLILNWHSNVQFLIVSDNHIYPNHICSILIFYSTFLWHFFLIHKYFYYFFSMAIMNKMAEQLSWIIFPFYWVWKCFKIISWV